MSSKGKTDTQVINEARALQGMYLVHAARKMHISHIRLRKLAKEHGLYFRLRKDDILSDSEILAHIKTYQYTESAQTMRDKIGVGWQRIKKIAAENGIELHNKRKTPNLNPMRCDDRGYWLKICSCCGEEKGVEYFYAASDSKIGLTSQCKLCIKLRQAGYIRKDRRQKEALA